MSNGDEEKDSESFISNDEFEIICKVLKTRHDIQDSSSEIFEKKSYLDCDDDNTIFKLSASDAFVEKAQYMLTKRAARLNWFGAISILFAFLIFVMSAYFLYNNMFINHFSVDGFEKAFPSISGTQLSLMLFQSTAVGGFIAAASALLIMVGRACLHEATILLNRRHALRFGRLYLNLTLGKSSLSVEEKNFSEQLMKMFMWNEEFSTAFKHMSHDLVKGLDKKILDALFARAMEEKARRNSDGNSEENKK